MYCACYFLLVAIYFIDPNGGRIGDAIEVKCRSDRDEWWTCIEPVQDNYVRLSLSWILCVN